MSFWKPTTPSGHTPQTTRKAGVVHSLVCMSDVHCALRMCFFRRMVPSLINNGLGLRAVSRKQLEGLTFVQPVKLCMFGLHVLTLSALRRKRPTRNLRAGNTRDIGAVSFGFGRPPPGLPSSIRCRLRGPGFHHDNMTQLRKPEAARSDLQVNSTEGCLQW